MESYAHTGAHTHEKLRAYTHENIPYTPETKLVKFNISEGAVEHRHLTCTKSNLEAF